MKTKRAVLLEAVSTGVQASNLKQSLPEQDARLHDIADRDDWEVVDIIVVPGFSRVYYTFREFAEAALAEGIAAPMRMFDHWNKRDFDVLAVSTGDRFGREQSIFAEVVTRTIDIGGQVFTLRDGYIDKGNYRMFVSMAGYSAAGEIDELVRRHKFGNNKRAKRGLPTTSHGLIPSHIIVGKGDTERAIVNEDARRLFADIAELLLTGMSFRQMVNVLAERGHHRRDGRRIPPETLRMWMMHPTLYGNTAQNFLNTLSGEGKALGMWVFDPSESAPPHVTINYGTHPPMYEGVLAERVKDEMRRRMSNSGRGNPPPRRKFTGLVVCDTCHYAVGYRDSGTYVAVNCNSGLHPSLMTGCTNTRYVRESKLVAFTSDLLRELAASQDWSLLFTDNEPDDTAQRLASIEREIKEVNAQADALMSERATLPTVFIDQYKANMARLASRAEALHVEHARLNQQLIATSPDASQLQALADFKNLPLDAFWQLSNVEINQWLHRLFGQRRLVIYEGEVIGTSGQRKQRRSSKDFA
jgi:DNA invertase Pin-like site-specific DNA recombinase